MILIRSRAVRWCALLGACTVPLAAGAQSPSIPDPSSSDTSTRPLRYESPFRDASGTGPQGLDRELLPWTRLFTADGEFVPEEALTGTGGGSRATNAAASEQRSNGDSGQGNARPTSGKDARGVVKAIYADRNRIKLKHGPIERLEMPGMTMVFRVKDPEALATLSEGDELDFSVDLEGSAFVVTEFEPVTQGGAAVAAGGSDSRGVVKAIYPDRNRVKLQHGPIEKLEMPAMTMVFRVADPALLDLIEEGKETGFTMEMRGSAFVVTGFQP